MSTHTQKRIEAIANEINEIGSKLTFAQIKLGDATARLAQLADELRDLIK